MPDELEVEPEVEAPEVEEEPEAPALDPAIAAAIAQAVTVATRQAIQSVVPAAAPTIPDEPSDEDWFNNPQQAARTLVARATAELAPPPAPQDPWADFASRHPDLNRDAIVLAKGLFLDDQAKYIAMEQSLGTEATMDNLATAVRASSVKRKTRAVTVTSTAKAPSAPSKEPKETVTPVSLSDIIQAQKRAARTGVMKGA